MKVELHEVKKNVKYLVSATFLEGSKNAFYQTWDKIQKKFTNEMTSEEK